ISAKRTFGAASRSSPSLRWNSSRYSSGTRPTSRNESTCPSFMAAPFIVPRAVTICSAASMWRRSSATCLPLSSRAMLAAWVPSWRVPWPAARRAMRAVRTMRDVGIRSLAIAGMVSGRGRRARRWRRLRRGGGRLRRGGRRRRRGLGRRRRRGGGRARRRRLGRRLAGGRRGRRRRRGVVLGLPAEERRRVAVAPHALAGDQLRDGDEGHGGHERDKPGDEREPPLAAGEPAALVDGALRRGVRQRLQLLDRGRGERVERLLWRRLED